MSYKAFISYRHSDFSRPHAEALENALRNYAKPWLSPPLAIFRDERVIPPGANLPEEIQRGLERSEFLLYLATSQAAQSEWVQDELRLWCDELGRNEKLIIVHLADEIGQNSASGEIVWQETNALPRLLEPHIEGIPLWVDLTQATSAEQRDLLNPDYRKSINAIVARFRGLKPGDMTDAAVLTHRRNITLRNLALGVIMTLAALATGAGFIATENAAQLARSLSESDFREAAVELAAERFPQAHSLLARAIRNDAGNDSASERLLHLLKTRELPIIERVAGPKEGPWLEFKASSNGRHAAALSAGGALRVIREGALEPWSPDLPEVQNFDIGGDVILAQTISGGFWRLDLDNQESRPIEFPMSSITSFDLTRDGSRVALANDEALCALRLAETTCDTRAEGRWQLEDDALSEDGVLLIAKLEKRVRALVTSPLDRKVRYFNEINDEIEDADDAFLGPEGAVCLVMSDPGSFEEEPSNTLRCYRDGYQLIVDAHFPSASLLQATVPPSGELLLAAVDNDEAHIFGSGELEEPLQINIPGLEGIQALATERAFFAITASGETPFFAPDSGSQLGLPLQLGARVAKAEPFADGIVLLFEDGSVYQWRARRLEAATGSRGSMPDWYEAPRSSSSGVTLQAGAETGDWLVTWPGGRKHTISHPLLMNELEAEQMAEQKGILPIPVADMAGVAPILVTAAANDSVIVWNVNDGQEIRRLSSPGEHLFASAVHVDDLGTKALVTYANEEKPDRFCYGTGTEEYALYDLFRGVELAAFSLPIGWTVRDATHGLDELLITSDHEIAIVDVRTGNHRVAISAESAFIRAVFDPSGRRFAGATDQGQVFVWDSSTGLPIADRWIFDPQPLAHNGPPCDDLYSLFQGPLRFSPDGKELGLLAAHLADDTSDPVPSPQVWTVGHSLSPSEIRRLEQLADVLAGSRLEQEGLFSDVRALDLGSLQRLLGPSDSPLRAELPAWLSESADR